jgi:hypothetical protein
MQTLEVNKIKNTFEFKSVDFIGNTLYCPCIDGEPYIILDTIIENIGLSRKFKEITPSNDFFKHLIYFKYVKKYTEQCIILHKAGCKTPFLTFFFTQSVENIIPNRKFILLPVRKLAAWLYTIEEKKVNEKARPILKEYKNLCDDVLYNYFSGNLSRRYILLNNLHNLNTKKYLLEEELKEKYDLFKEYVSIKEDITKVRKAIKNIDEGLVSEKNVLVQTEMDFQLSQ